MILTGIVYLLYWVVKLVLLPFTLLPDVTIGSTFSDAVTTASGYITSLNAFVPIATIVSILAIDVLLETSFLTYKFIMWGIRKIPTIN